MKTPYQQKMDQLGLEDYDLFKIAFNKTVHFTTALSAKYAKNTISDERTFLLRSITRMTNLMRSVYALFLTTKDRASMMILARSIIDLNALVCFLFQFVTDGEGRSYNGISGSEGNTNLRTSYPSFTNRIICGNSGFRSRLRAILLILKSNL